MEKVKKEYNEIAKKHNLPSWEQLDKEYELGYVGPVAEISFPLRFVRRRINDRFAAVAGFLQGLLHPNTGSLINIQESKFFSDADRKIILNLLKEFMQLERTSFALDLTWNEKEEAEFIKNAHKKWLESKKQLEIFAEKLRTGWKEESNYSKGAYFG